MMAYLSESLLYISFSLVLGYYILQLVPEKAKPTVSFPPYLLSICVLMIPICTFIPIHQNALEYTTTFKLGYWAMLKSILLDLRIGEAWLWTLIGSLGLFTIATVPVFKHDKHMPKVGLMLTLLLTFWFGFASHAASLSAFKGLIVHTGHFLAVIVWLGILFIISWFSTDFKHWNNFLRWFSPLAIFCVLIALIAGFTLMTFTTPQYVNSWMLDYGQFLLLKHLSIIPLLWLGYTNGFLYKKQVKLHHQEKWSPLPYLKIESILAIIVLVLTAAMGQQVPPHELTETLQSESPSMLFTTLYPFSFSPDIALTLAIHTKSLLLWLAALLLLYASYVAFRGKHYKSMLIVLLLMIILIYLGFMFALSPASS